MSNNFYLYLVGYCVVILGASLLGGFIPFLVRLTHRRMQFAISFVAGFILGIALLHLLPTALGAVPASQAVNWVIIGMLVMFFLERFFCFHHHDVEEANVDHASCKNPPADVKEEVEKHVHGKCGCHEVHKEGNEQISRTAHEHKLTWSGAAVGLTLHSVIAGIALAAAMAGDGGTFWPGIGVFMVVVLHKPFDSMTLGTLMAASGWSKGWRHVVNMLFALAVPLGAVLFLAGIGVAGEVTDNTFVGCAIAFSAGVFLVVSLSDLLPEIQFHHHDRFSLSFALLLGLGLAYGVLLFEGHDHGAHGSTTTELVDPHAGYNHTTQTLPEHVQEMLKASESTDSHDDHAH
ncbi:ZIP family metal transporter [Poriferisphaera sp. WC338]|uniref:ZIP family metal transporter n=1 Tax=Poriferisphaera sp. WC338 TaxID=3425129 RepID=UPI003D8167AB